MLLFFFIILFFFNFNFCFKNIEKIQKNMIFMPHRSRDNQGNFLPTTPTSSHSHPSLFFSLCEVEDTIGEPFENF